MLLPHSCTTKVARWFCSVVLPFFFSLIHSGCVGLVEEAMMCAESLLQVSAAERQAWAVEAEAKAETSSKEAAAAPAAEPAVAVANGGDPCPALLAQFYLLARKVAANVSDLAANPLLPPEKETRLARFSVSVVAKLEKKHVANYVFRNRNNATFCWVCRAHTRLTATASLRCCRPL
jgi:hypothetical protein